MTKKEDAAKAIKKLTQGRGVDFVFVTVGAKAAFDRAFDYITKNGTVVIVGMPPSGVMAEYDPGTVAAWNQKILGSKMGGGSFAIAVHTGIGHAESFTDLSEELRPHLDLPDVGALAELLRR